MEVIYGSVLEAIIFPATDDDTGRVCGGHLRIKGPLFRSQKPGSIRSRINGQDLRLDMRMDFRPTLQSNSYHGPARLTLTTTKGNTINAQMNHHFEREALESSSQLFLLSILSDQDSGMSYTAGLVLYPFGKLRGQYTRVGMFRCEDKDYQDVLWQNRETLPEQCYEEYDGAGKYTIKIF